MFLNIIIFKSWFYKIIYFLFIDTCLSFILHVNIYFIVILTKYILFKSIFLKLHLKVFFLIYFFFSNRNRKIYALKNSLVLCFFN